MVSFTPLPLYLRERVPGTHFIGVFVDPRAGLGDMKKWKFLTLQELELRLFGRPVQPVVSRYTDYALPAVVNSSKEKAEGLWETLHLLRVGGVETSWKFSTLKVPGSARLSFR
jgi:hypothetical protein